MKNLQCMRYRGSLYLLQLNPIRHSSFSSASKISFSRGNKVMVFLHTYVVISVWLWNFKGGGSQKVRFLANNQHTPKEKSLKDTYEECQFIKNWA